MSFIECYFQPVLLTEKQHVMDSNAKPSEEMSQAELADAIQQQHQVLSLMSPTPLLSSSADALRRSSASIENASVSTMSSSLSLSLSTDETTTTPQQHPSSNSLTSSSSLPKETESNYLYFNPQAAKLSLLGPSKDSAASMPSSILSPSVSSAALSGTMSRANSNHHLSKAMGSMHYQQQQQTAMQYANMRGGSELNRHQQHAHHRAFAESFHSDETDVETDAEDGEWARDQYAID
jgi:hypothetical protein